MQVLSAVRCPFCHDELELAPHVACGRCATGHHVECFVSNGGCTVLGCRSLPQARRIQLPATPREPARSRPWTTAAITVGIFGALALGAAAFFRSVACENALAERGNAETKRSNERYASETFERIRAAEHDFLKSRARDDPRRFLTLNSLAASGVVDSEVLHGAHGYLFSVNLYGELGFQVSAVPVSEGLAWYTASEEVVETCFLPNSGVIPTSK